MFHLELDAGGIQRGHKSLSLVSLTCNIVGGSNHKPKTTQDNHTVFPSGCEGKLGVELESLQGRRDLW